MKKLALIASLAILVSCSKTNSKPADPTSTEPSITVLSASVQNISGINMLGVNLNFVNPNKVQKSNLVVYTGATATSTDYRYAVALKDGDQTVYCSKWSASSPVYYQIEYFFLTGEHTFSEMKSVSF